MLFNKVGCTISTGRNRLHRSAGEPINNRATQDNTKQHHRVKQIKFEVQQQDDRENHRCRTNNRRTNKHRFCCCFKGITGTVIRLQKMLTFFKIWFKTIIVFNLFFCTTQSFNLRKFKNRLSVIGHRTIAINGNGNRPHSEHTERHQTKSKHSRINHKVTQTFACGKESDNHQANHNQSLPKSRHITGHNTGNNVQRSAGFTAGFNNFLNVLRFRRRKDFGKFRNKRRRQRSAADNQRQTPPQIGTNR